MCCRLIQRRSTEGRKPNRSESSPAIQLVTTAGLLALSFAKPSGLSRTYRAKSICWIRKSSESWMMFSPRFSRSLVLYTCSTQFSFPKSEALRISQTRLNCLRLPDLTLDLPVRSVQRQLDTNGQTWFDLSALGSDAGGAACCLPG